MSFTPKILLGCPINSVKEYCIDDFFSHIKKLTYTNVDFLFVDNSVDNSWHKKMAEKYNVEILYVSPIGMRNCDYMCLCNNYLRERAIEGCYDYFFSLECDLFPPINIIDELLIWDADFVSAPYFISESEFSELCRSEIDRFSPHFLNRNVATVEGYVDFDGTLKILDGTGIGCALIKVELMRQIPFRTIKHSNNHADTWFHQDMVANGIDNLCDTSLIIEHRNQNWNYIGAFNFQN